MGFWFNNFQEFERKKGRENRLILNFYYVPSPGEKAKKVKIFLKRSIKIPTGFIFSPEKIEKIKSHIAADPELKNFPLNSIKVGNYSVFYIELPNRKELIDRLPKEFQTGNYDKILRLNSFYPERKAGFSEKLEKKIQENDILELDSLEGVYDQGFLNENEIKNLPWLYLDIEKPLWKSEKEKMFLKARKKLLKLQKKYGNKDKKQELREKAIRKLEDRLTIDTEGVGKIGLWQEECDASVSFITTVWKNIPGEKDIREIFMLDPKNEFEYEELNNYKICKFRTEKELISSFIGKTNERKPVIASGHNEVYDITQIRFAAEGNKLMFDPAVKEIKPRRDFVRYFFQRMKEDLIYIDSLWLSATFYPWLRQRTFSSLKLESVSNFHGIEFKKSLTHEQLREIELQRLAGKTKEIRKEAGKRIADYSAGDVEPVIQIMEKSPFISLVVKLKEALPFCTLTEIAFHPNCANKYHDKKHFDRAGNLRYYGYAQKERENEIQIFKKRFSSLKGKMLDWAGISTKTPENKQEKVYEIYLPFEEWIKDSVFNFAYEFQQVYEKLDEKEKIPFLQYLKALERDMLVDYYFARREGKIFCGKFKDIKMEKFSRLEEMVAKDLLDKYAGSFKFLKNHFRSIYVALDGKGRALIRASKKNLSEIGEIPSIMEDESDLFLLKDRAEEIRKTLSPAQSRILTTFLTNFKSLEQTEKEIGNKIPELTENPRELLYAYNQSKRKQQKEKEFFARYRISVSDLTSLIAKSYRNLAKELEKYNTRIMDIKGDYMFVQADESIKSSSLVYIVREIQPSGVITFKKPFQFQFLWYSKLI